MCSPRQAGERLARRLRIFWIVPPGWRPEHRDRVVKDFKLPNEIQLINASTPYVVIIGRTKSDGPA
jgi:hypothetical protein